MLLYQIKENYKVQKDERGKTLHLYDKREGSGSRMVHKYLVTAYKVKTGVYEVFDNSPCSHIEDFIDDVNLKISEYEWDSEYYNPQLRKGIFEEWVVMDELVKKGFKSNGSEHYILKLKNIYGQVLTSINIWLNGIDSMTNVDEDGLSKKIKILLDTGNWSWVEGDSVKRNVNDILEGVDKLVAPLLLGNTLSNLEAFEKTKIYNVDDVKIKRITLTGKEERPLKEELILQLENALKILKHK